MKFSKLCYATSSLITFLAFGCAENKEKTDTTTTLDTMATEPAPSVASTVVTTPQLMLIAKHKTQARVDRGNGMVIKNEGKMKRATKLIIGLTTTHNSKHHLPLTLANSY